MRPCTTTRQSNSKTIIAKASGRAFNKRVPEDTAAVRSYFVQVGLDPEVTELYLALCAYGPQGVMQLSRHSGIERTRIYRSIDRLIAANLVEVENHYKRNIYKAAPITNLQILLSKKEQELRKLQADLDTLGVSLPQSSLHSPLTHVQSYSGADGLKQMFWNQTKAQTSTVAILYENMQNKTNSAFFQRWVEKCNQQDLAFRGIIGDHFITTQQQWYATHHNERLTKWEARYVADNVFPITHSTITYDDVVAYYNWKQGEIFGIEIYNTQIAQAQRRFFTLLWERAEPVDDLIGPQTTP